MYTFTYIFAIKSTTKLNLIDIFQYLFSLSKIIVFSILNIQNYDKKRFGRNLIYTIKRRIL